MLDTRSKTPFNPNNIIVGDKEPSVYVGTVIRQFLAGTKHVELRNRGPKGRRKLFEILDLAGMQIHFKKSSLESLATKYQVSGEEGTRDGMDNTLALDLSEDTKVEGQK